MPETTTETKTATVKLGDFRGAFAMFALGCYNDLLAAGFERPVAHLMACDFSSDLGNAMSKDSDLCAKVSKAKSEGESRFNISGKTGYVKQSNVMSIARVCQQFSALKKEGLLTGHKVPVELLNDDLQEYVDDVTARAEDTDFVEAK